MRLWYLAIPTLLLGVLTAEDLIGTGMFMDGVYYAALARGLSEGIGSFWNVLVGPGMDRFIDHPPLGIWLLSQFMDVLGYGRWVEKFFSLSMAVIHGLLLWTIFRMESRSQSSFLGALILSVVAPVTNWMVFSNQLEMPMMTFVLAATAFFVLATQRGLWWNLGVGASLAGAVMTKGVLGLFPLALPVAFWLSGRRFSFKFYLAFFFTTFGALAMVYFASPEFWLLYLRNQVGASLKGAREIHDPYFKVYVKVLGELGAMIGCVLLVWLSLGRPQVSRIFRRVRHDWAFWIGLSASLPLAISPKNRMWFLYPCVPFFAMAIAGATDTLWDHFVHLPVKFWRRLLFILAILFIGALWLSRDYDRTNRGYISDVLAHSTVVSPKSTMELCSSIEWDWSLRADLVRDLFVSLVRPGEFYLAEMGFDCNPDPSCRLIPHSKAERYSLYWCK